MSIPSIKRLALAAAIALAAACSDDTAAPQQSITVNFAAQVNDTAFDTTCQSKYSPIGAGTGSGLEYKAVDYRMYIHNVHVHDAILGERQVTLDQDGVWQYEDVALLDFEDATTGNDCTGTPEMNTKIVGSVDPDVDLNNVQVCFDIGVPFELNHLDQSDPGTPSPLNVTGMMWVWKNGHKFIRIDGKGDPDGANVDFNLHLGSQGDCQALMPGTSVPAAQCSEPNYFEACVDNFDVDNDTIAVDVADVLEANDVTANSGMASGCQSFPGDADCEQVFHRLNLDYTYGGTGGTPSGPKGQKLFSKM